MIIGEISFCDQVGFNIKSDETKKHILDRLYAKYKLRIITKHFEKFDDVMVAEDNKSSIVNRPHMLCVRSNGNPYFLYLVKLNFTNYCIFIDKKIQQGYAYPRMIIAHFKFDDCLFADTIFDGEMVKTTDGYWSYLINDLVVYQGQHLTESNLIRRINLLYDALDKYFTVDENDICKLFVKKYFHCTEGDYIMNTHINKVNYSCRGIYFKPLFLKFKDILINFDDNLIKKVERQKYKHLKSFMLKEDGDKLMDQETASVASSCSSDLHVNSASTSTSSTPSISSTAVTTTSILTVKDSNSAIFLTRKTNLPDVYEMLETTNDKFGIPLKVIGHACVPSMHVSKYMRMIFINKNIVDTVPITYVRNTNTNFNQKWIPQPT
jgi:hypothetical protein